MTDDFKGWKPASRPQRVAPTAPTAPTPVVVDWTDEQEQVFTELFKAITPFLKKGHHEDAAAAFLRVMETHASAQKGGAS